MCLRWGLLLQARYYLVWTSLQTKRANNTQAVFFGFPRCGPRGGESEVGLESSQQLNMQMETDYLLHYILLCYKPGNSTQQKVISIYQQPVYCIPHFITINIFCFIPCRPSFRTQTLGFYNMKCYNENFKEKLNWLLLLVIYGFSNLEEIIRAIKYFKSMFCQATENKGHCHGK